MLLHPAARRLLRALRHRAYGYASRCAHVLTTSCCSLQNTISQHLPPHPIALLAAASLAHHHDSNNVEHDAGGTAGDAVWPVEGEGGAKLPHLCMLVNSRSGGGAGGELIRKLTCVPHCTILDLSPDAFAAAAESPVSTSTRVQVPPAT